MLSRIPLIIDTDIGDDIDDLQALVLALASPDVDLLAVTTVFGDTDRRASLARLLLEAGGRPEVPVACGAMSALLAPGRENRFGGHGLDLAAVRQGPVDTTAPALLTQLIRQHQGEVELLTIGALTNIALVLELWPELAKQVRRYHLMGGCFGARPQLHSTVEYNIRCDPEAAAAVFAAGFNLTVVGLDVTTQVELPGDHLEPLRRSAHPLAKLYVAAVGHFLSEGNRQSNIPHDVLTLAALLRPELIRTEPMPVAVELRGEYTRGLTVTPRRPAQGQPAPATAQVAVAVDVAAFLDFYLERLHRLFGV
jgi:inosine-uridine nucleoside N-ribohydrolase